MIDILDRPYADELSNASTQWGTRVLLTGISFMHILVSFIISLQSCIGGEAVLAISEDSPIIDLIENSPILHYVTAVMFKSMWCLDELQQATRTRRLLEDTAVIAVS